jgi:hypothetical protein
MAGWGSQRLAEERELRIKRIPPTSAAISRHDEVVGWISEFVTDEQGRRLVWAWSICHVAGTSFAGRCRKNGWARATAYRRLDAIIEVILMHLRKRGVLLRLPDDLWVRQVEGVSGTSDGEIGRCVDPLPISPTWISDGDRPRDMLTSPQAIEEFGDHLQSVNNQRRKDRERKQRKLLGID